jgi:hypothetical protein
MNYSHRMPAGIHFERHTDSNRPVSLLSGLAARLHRAMQQRELPTPEPPAIAARDALQQITLRPNAGRP